MYGLFSRPFNFAVLEDYAGQRLLANFTWVSITNINSLIVFLFDKSTNNVGLIKGSISG